MSTIKTIEEVREFARKFQAVIDLAAAVEPIAKLELAEAELRGQVGALQAERDALVEEVAGAKATAARIVEEAKAKAAELFEAATASAQAATGKLVESAQAQVAGINDDAKAEADRLAKRIAKLKAEEADLDRDIDARRAQVVDLESRLAAAQEKARAMIGG